MANLSQLPLSAQLSLNNESSSLHKKNEECDVAPHAVPSFAYIVDSLYVSSLFHTQAVLCTFSFFQYTHSDTLLLSSMQAINLSAFSRISII